MAVTQVDIDRQVFTLYDEYCHGRIDRREFLKRAGALGAGALAMAYGLMPDYARAQTVSFTDPRIRAQYVSYPSPGGNADTIKGYLVQPAGQGPFPAVLVIHENRGLNPYVEDVARRAAVSDAEVRRSPANEPRPLRVRHPVHVAASWRRGKGSDTSEVAAPTRARSCASSPSTPRRRRRTPRQPPRSRRGRRSTCRVLPRRPRRRTRS